MANSGCRAQLPEITATSQPGTVPADNMSIRVPAEHLRLIHFALNRTILAANTSEMRVQVQSRRALKAKEGELHQKAKNSSSERVNG